MSYYKVIESFSSFNPSTGEAKEFEAGETIQAETKTASVFGVGSISGLISNGYPIPDEYVQKTVNPYLLYFGIGTLALLIIFGLFRIIKL